MKAYKVTVEGRGTFPLDMLRYDQCYPLKSDDAVNIATGKGERRKVTLVSDKPFVIARWNSFGWSVTKAE